MRGIIAAALMTVAVAAHGDDETFAPITDEQREHARALVTVVAAGVILPAAGLLLVGEVFDATCRGAGFEFRENLDYDGSGVHWYCTGLPRKE